VGGVLVPGLVVAVGAAVPWMDKTGPISTGVWFARQRRIHNAIFLVFCVVLVVLTVVGTFLRGPHWHIYWPWEAWPVSPPSI
jgi:quinol-cytochrome oxidoreductase complex cytochrome b subunit